MCDRFEGNFFDVTSVDELRQCIRTNQDINMTNILDHTPFIHYCFTNKTDLVLELLKYDFDASKYNIDDRTGLFYVCSLGNTNLLCEFLKYPFIMNTLQVGDLIGGIVDGYVDIFDILVSYDRKLIHQKDSNGKTPLMTACQYLQIDIIDRLLQYDLNVDDCDYKGNTALHYTCGLTIQRQNIGAPMIVDFGRDYRSVIIDKLVSYGANVNLANNRRWIPFKYLIEHEHIDIITKLLDYGSDINSVCNHGKTALDLANLFGKPHIVEILLLRTNLISKQI